MHVLTPIRNTQYAIRKTQNAPRWFLVGTPIRNTQYAIRNAAQSGYAIRNTQYAIRKPCQTVLRNTQKAASRRNCSKRCVWRTLHLSKVGGIILGLEPWLSSCRAVEAPSSRCRGRCRGLACRALSSLSSSCRAPSRLTTCGGASSCCRGLSRAVEFLCRGCRVMSSVLSSSRMACSFAILHEAL